MSIEDPIEPSLHLRFQAERLSRTIKECQELEILREIAMELLELHQKNSAIADWATRRAAEAEYRDVIQDDSLDSDRKKNP